MRSKLITVVFVLLSSINTVFAADAGIMIQDPWVREAPPNAKMLAGYFSIMNHSQHERVLVGASSPQFKKVELHRTEMDGDMAKMVAQDRVQVPIGQTVKFEPGALHLMLMNPVKPLKAGDTVELTIKFSNGDTMKFNAVVKKGTGTSHQHEHMHMHMPE